MRSKHTSLSNLSMRMRSLTSSRPKPLLLPLLSGR